MDADYEHAARHLQLALAEGFAPKIDDMEAMEFARGLRDGVPEAQMNLTTVPIGVVYSAMFAFLRLQAPTSKDVIGKIACGLRQITASIGQDSLMNRLAVQEWHDRISGFAAELEAATKEIADGS